MLVEALNVDEDELTPAATLQGDPGAESIDFLDIIARTPGKATKAAAPRPAEKTPEQGGATR